MTPPGRVRSGDAAVVSVGSSLAVPTSTQAQRNLPTRADCFAGDVGLPLGTRVVRWVAQRLAAGGRAPERPLQALNTALDVLDVVAGLRAPSAPGQQPAPGVAQPHNDLNCAAFAPAAWQRAEALLRTLRASGLPVHAYSESPADAAGCAELMACLDALRDYEPTLRLVSCLAERPHLAAAVRALGAEVAVPADLTALRDLALIVPATPGQPASGSGLPPKAAPATQTDAGTCLPPKDEPRLFARLQPRPLLAASGARNQPAVSFTDAQLLAAFAEGPLLRTLAQNPADDSHPLAQAHALDFAGRLLVLARLAELARARPSSPAAPSLAACSHWLQRELRADAVTGVSAEPLLRLACALALDPLAVWPQAEAAKPPRHLMALWRACDTERAARALTELLAALPNTQGQRPNFAAAGRAAATVPWEAALAALFAPELAPEPEHVLRAWLTLAKPAKLAWAQLEAAPRTALLRAFNTLPPPWCAALAFILLDAPLAALMAEAATPPAALAMVRTLEALPSTSLPALFGGAEAPFGLPALLALRLSLLGLAPEQGVEAWAEACLGVDVAAVPEVARAEAVISLWRRHHGEGRSQALYALLGRLLARQWLGADAARTQLAAHAVADGAVLQHARHTLLSTPAADVPAWLAAWQGRLALLGPAAATTLLRARQAHDRQRRPTLLAAATRAAESTRAAGDRAAPATALLGGVPLPVAPRGAGRPAAVPTLHLGPTTHENLRLLALAWLQKEPIWLEGPAASGKTTLVAYVAASLGLSCQRINLSPTSETADLLGRWAFVAAPNTKTVPAPQWLDGPLVTAMREGQVLLLDEANLAPTEVLERLNSLFDDEGGLTLQEHANEWIKPHPNFRCLAAVNPSSYSARHRLTAAMRSRWQKVPCRAPASDEICALLSQAAPTLPAPLAKQVAAAHADFVRAGAEGSFERGTSFSLRAALRASERLARLAATGAATPAAVRRELWEVYAGGFASEDDQRTAARILALGPGEPAGLYGELALTSGTNGLRLGDVDLYQWHVDDPRVPTAAAALSLTPRTQRFLYRFLKALAAGEHVALVGPHAVGKTALVRFGAHLLGQPYHRLTLGPDTEPGDLVGRWQVDGWHDGPLLQAARPTGPPGLLLLDEANLASPAVLERLNSVLDDSRSLTLAEKDGEVVALHQGFRFVAAMNPATAHYGGRRPLSAALKTRLTTIAIGEPAADELAALAAVAGRTHKLPSALIERQLRVHHAVQAAHRKNATGEPGPSLRELLAVLAKTATLCRFFGREEACLEATKLTYAHFLAPAELTELAQKVQPH